MNAFRHKAQTARQTILCMVAAFLLVDGEAIAQEISKNTRLEGQSTFAAPGATAPIVKRVPTPTPEEAVTVLPERSVSEATGEESEQARRLEQAGPFDAGDPFAILKDAKSVQQSESEVKKAAWRKLDFKGSLFSKVDHAEINRNSSFNPDNMVQNLKNDNTIFQARMTLADSLDEDQKWRWLVKGFGDTTDFPEGDGVLRKHARIDETFIDWKSENLFATAGKRRVNWGHAQGFNVVNVVAPPRDPLNPDYETEGQPMVWLSYAGTVTTDVLLTRGNYRAGYGGDKERWGVRWSLPKAEADYAVYYYDGANYSDGRSFDRMLGASFSANVVPGLTFYGEFAEFSENYRNYYDASGVAQRKANSFFKGVVGSLLDLGSKSNVFVEFMYNGQGYTKDERKNYLAAVDTGFPSGRAYALMSEVLPLSMNLNYALIGYKKEYRERYGLNVSLLAAGDRSSSARIEVSYLFSDYFDIKASYLRNSGRRLSEFGNSSYSELFELQLSTNF